MRRDTGNMLKQEITHLKELFLQRFEFLEKAIGEAKRLGEKMFEGFPAEYAKKSELEITGAATKDIKDKDLKEIKVEMSKFVTRTELIATIGIASAILLGIIEAIKKWGGK